MASALCDNKPEVVSSTLFSSSSSYVSLSSVISQVPSTLSAVTFPFAPNTSETTGVDPSSAVSSILKVEFPFTINVPSPLISTLALLVSVMLISTALVDSFASTVTVPSLLMLNLPSLLTSN